MATSTGALPASGSVTASSDPLWEKMWRSAGLQFAGLFVLAYFLYGHQPSMGASPDTLTAFYSAERLKILIAAVLGGLGILNLMWFAEALKAVLTDAHQDGWGAAATASSAALGGLWLLLIAVNTALTLSIAGPANAGLPSLLNDCLWTGVVMSSFPRAMLIMSAAFGLWRAKIISNGLFAIGVAAVILVLLGGTTWASGGFWAPDGLYSRLVSPIIGLAWLAIVSRVLLTRIPATHGEW
jgi:hypothetical protein